MASSVIVDALNGLDGATRKAVANEFRTGAMKELVQSGTNHAKIALENHRQMKFRSVEGMGRLRLRVDPYHYHHYGQKYGYACWRDKEFLRDVEKKHPELKVNCGGTKTSSGYTCAGQGTIFSKKY